MLTLLVSLSVLTFLDRLAIAAAGTRMQKDLNLTPDQWGWVLGAFVLGYGAFEIPTGALGDRLGRKRVITRIVLWWSAFTALSGAAFGFMPLVLTRFLFGVGEAGAYPNMAGVISQSFAAKDRAIAQGVVWAASRMGGALSPLLVVPIQAAYGWRTMFYLFGAAGLIWCLIWLWLYREPAAAKAKQGHHHEAPWGALLRSGQLWIIATMYFCYAWGSWFYFSWLHTWLVKGRGFSESEMALFSSIPFVSSAAGSFAGGFLSDASVRKFGMRWGRVLIGTTCLSVGSALLVATALNKDRDVAVVLLTLGFGVMDLMLPSAWAICLDVSGRHAGAVTGAMNTAGQFGGFLCTVVFGYVVSATGNYDLPLLIIAALVACAAVLFTRIDASRPMFKEEAA